MSQAFVPFSTSAPGVKPAEAGARVKLVADKHSGQGFRPLADVSHPACPTPAAGHEPKVTLEREGNRVTRIKVECVCGYTFELACE